MKPVTNEPQFLLSVVIATKDREQYCIAAIDSILSYKDERIEITVADNSATTKVKDYVASLNHPAVKYTYDSGAVSSIGNFNKAMDLATGEYVVFIGDDDTILPNCADWAQWMKDNDIESLSSSNTVNYIWPIADNPKLSTGELLFPESFTFKVTRHDNVANLKRFMADGTVAYQAYNLSKVYHGIVKKAVMDKIKARTGHYFGGISPDLYSAAALSINIKNNYSVDAPFSILGACQASTTYGVIAKQHVGHIKDAPHLRHRDGYELEGAIPKIYSAYVVWTESLLKSLKENAREDLIKDINFPLYYAHINDEFMVMDKQFLGTLDKELDNCFKDRNFGVEEIKQFEAYKKHLNYINQKHKVKSFLLRSLQKLGLMKQRSGASVIKNMLDIRDVIAYVDKHVDMSKRPQL